MIVMNDSKEPGLEDAAAGSAWELRQALVSDALIDEGIAHAGDHGVSFTGEGGLLPELVKAVLEHGLAVESDDHLGYAKGGVAARGSPNSRNGFSTGLYEGSWAGSLLARGWVFGPKSKEVLASVQG